MSSTAQYQVQQLVVAALAAAPALADGRVYANRVRPMTATAATAVAVRMERSSGTSPTLHTVDWRTALLVECYARSVANSDPAAAVDALLFDAWARLSVLRPEGLGAMDFDLDPDITWDFDDAAEPMVCATLRLTAEHRTTTDTLTPWT